MADRIVRKEATGRQIHSIIAKMEPSLLGEEKHHVLIACLSVAILIMNPDINSDQLSEGVTGASEWISLYLTGRNEEGELEPSQLN